MSEKSDIPIKDRGPFLRVVAIAERHPLATIAIFLLLVLGPFLNKAVHNDDALFVWTAEQILKHPADFFGFTVNWYGTADPMATVTCNPPTLSYLFAAVIAILGEHEIYLHGVMLAIAFAAAAGVYQLARLWCDRPLLATLAGLSTPVFLVSAATLMCDVPMLAAWIWAVVLWEWALQSGRKTQFLAAMVLAGLAVLTKYSAITLLPLLPILAILRQGKIGRCLLWLTVPVAMVGLYQWGTGKIYGQGLISAASAYAAQTRFGVTGGLLNKIIIGLAYLGGVMLPVLFFAPRLWTKRQLFTGGTVVLAIAAAVVWGFAIGQRFGLGFQLQMTLMLAAGIHFCVLVLAELRPRGSAVSLYPLSTIRNQLTMALWFASTFLFAAVLNWTVSGRSLLPLVPIAGILLARRLGRGYAVAVRSTRDLVPVAGSLAFSLAVVTADVSLANASRDAARQIGRNWSAAVSRLWFEGHGGLQFYLEKARAVPVDFSASLLAPGDVLVLPSNNSNLIPPGNDKVEPLATLTYGANIALSTVHAGTGAGFYGAGGLLPFVLGPVPAEEFYVYRVTQPLSFAPPEALNNRAWALATDPDAAKRNAAEAVRLAQYACEATQYQKTQFIGTLAAAQAAAGNFDDAIATAQRACTLAAKNGETNLLQINQALLERYRAHQPAQ